MLPGNSAELEDAVGRELEDHLWDIFAVNLERDAAWTERPEKQVDTPRILNQVNQHRKTENNAAKSNVVTYQKQSTGLHHHVKPKRTER